MCDKIKCPKCGGTGYIPTYNHVEDGICFLCNGSGWISESEYKHIQEQEATRNIKRMAKQQYSTKQARGFYTDTVYLVSGNTYKVKDQLKQQGAKWNFWLNGFTFVKDNDNYKTIAINYDDIKDFDDKQLESYLNKFKTNIKYEPIKNREQSQAQKSSESVDEVLDELFKEWGI